MANVYTSLPVGDTCIATIKAALIAQYGVGNVTVHYETTAAFIFSCAEISNKVIRLIKGSSTSGSFTVSYGDSWTSGTTIVNPVTVITIGSTVLSSTMDLILGTNYMLLVTLTTVNTAYNNMWLIGKLTNNQFIVAGYGVNSAASFGVTKITDGTVIEMFTFVRTFNDATSKLYKQPVMFIASTGALLINTDGTAATIDGLFNASQVLPSSLRLVGANSFISPSTYTQPTLATSLLAEWV